MFFLGPTKVWTRAADNSSFRCGPQLKLKTKSFTTNFRMIRLRTTFTDISADLMYDVLHDPVYRKVFYSGAQEPRAIVVT